MGSEMCIRDSPQRTDFCERPSAEACAKLDVQAPACLLRRGPDCAGLSALPSRSALVAGARSWGYVERCCTIARALELCDHREALREAGLDRGWEGATDGGFDAREDAVTWLLLRSRVIPYQPLFTEGVDLLIVYPARRAASAAWRQTRRASHQSSPAGRRQSATRCPSGSSCHCGCRARR